MTRDPKSDRPAFRPTAAACFAALAVLTGLASTGCGRPAASSEAPPRVRIALHGDPNSLDPHLQAEVIAESVLGNVYESLVAFGPGMRPVPQLAETWSNPSDLEWRFRLRDGVTFHDGRPLRIEDVLASIERVRSHPRSRQAGALVAVASARRVDERTLALVTDRPYPILLNRLTLVSIVPADAPADIALPIGTGPYRVVSHAAGRVDLEAVADHWRGLDVPPLAEYHFVADDAERCRGLLEGRYHLVDEVPQGRVAEIEADPGARLEAISSLLVTYLHLDPAHPPLGDPRVRRALSLALDREALVRELYGDYAVAAGQMVSRDVFGYDPRLAPPARDLETARALLAEAGYGDGLRLVLEMRDGRQDGPPVARQLSEAGVEVELVTRPWGEMYPRLVAMQVPFYLGGWVSSSGDAGTVLDRKLHSRQTEPGYGDANYSDHRNPELDRLIRESNSVLSLEERHRLLQRALAMAGDDHVYLPLYSPDEVYGVDEDLAWTPRQDGRVYAHEVRRR